MSFTVLAAVINTGQSDCSVDTVRAQDSEAGLRTSCESLCRRERRAAGHPDRGSAEHRLPTWIRCSTACHHTTASPIHSTTPARTSPTFFQAPLIRLSMNSFERNSQFVALWVYAIQHPSQSTVVGLPIRGSATPYLHMRKPEYFLVCVIIQNSVSSSMSRRLSTDERLLTRCAQALRLFRSLSPATLLMPV